MEEWRSPTPAGAADILAGIRVPWWIAGGWAIELFVGGGVRTHSDLDIGCFRPHLGHVLRHLAGWDIRVASQGRLLPLPPGDIPTPDVHGLWCRPNGSAAWMLELLIEELDRDAWVYRRDARVHRPAGEITSRDSTGLSFLRPEIQLLYKSRAPRPRDDDDFRATWPLLDDSARSWLAASLRMVSPGHEWLEAAEA